MPSMTIPPDLVTSVPDIDQQHAVFLALTNRVLSADPRAPNHAQMLRELSALVRYVDYHFAAEESEMRAHAYLGTRHHVAHHERLRRSLYEILELSRLPGTARPVAVRLRLLVEEWFVDHIRRMDIDFAQFLLQATASPNPRLPGRDDLRRTGVLPPLRTSPLAMTVVV